MSKAISGILTLGVGLCMYLSNHVDGESENFIKRGWNTQGPLCFPLDSVCAPLCCKTRAVHPVPSRVVGKLEAADQEFARRAMKSKC